MDHVPHASCRRRRQPLPLMNRHRRGHHLSTATAAAAAHLPPDPVTDSFVGTPHPILSSPTTSVCCARPAPPRPAAMNDGDDGSVLPCTTAPIEIAGAGRFAADRPLGEQV